jgi:hypothetical protein
MRCALRPLLARCGLPVLLILAVAPTTVFAQSPVCHAIRRGESATQAANRVTGDSRNAYQAWFQIRNPSSRSIPKSQYNRIRAGWQACVPKRLVRLAQASEALDASNASNLSASFNALPVSAPVAQPAVLVSGDGEDEPLESPPSRLSAILRAIGSADLTMLWLGAAMVVPWVGWRFLDDHLVRKKTTTLVMRHFATRFVREFERPLVWSDAAERPVRSRVRYSVRRKRLEILLAPGRGRRYPNLSDHKKNVEYDVERVRHLLADASFVDGPPYSQAEWVVVPFQFKAGPRQSGVTCISSL